MQDDRDGVAFDTAPGTHRTLQDGATSEAVACRQRVIMFAQFTQASIQFRQTYTGMDN